MAQYVKTTILRFNLRFTALHLSFDDTIHPVSDSPVIGAACIDCNIYRFRNLFTQAMICYIRADGRNKIDLCIKKLLAK